LRGPKSLFHEEFIGMVVGLRWSLVGQVAL
jgi:hypothetical protein